MESGHSAYFEVEWPPTEEGALQGSSLRQSLTLTFAAICLGAMAGCATAVPQTRIAHEMGEVRSAELKRLRALVSADIASLDQLHAENFQVINPRGRSLSKADYLRSVASGESDYISLEADEIEVRMQGPMAAIRYRIRFEISVRGRRLPPGQAWHTGFYERREGQWQIVWDHVTEIAPTGN